MTIDELALMTAAAIGAAAIIAIAVWGVATLVAYLRWRRSGKKSTGSTGVK